MLFLGGQPCRAFHSLKGHGGTTAFNRMHKQTPPLWSEGREEQLTPGVGGILSWMCGFELT